MDIFLPKEEGFLPSSHGRICSCRYFLRLYAQCKLGHHVQVTPYKNYNVNKCFSLARALLKYWRLLGMASGMVSGNFHINRSPRRGEQEMRSGCFLPRPERTSHSAHRALLKQGSGAPPAWKLHRVPHRRRKSRSPGESVGKRLAHMGPKNASAVCLFFLPLWLKVLYNYFFLRPGFIVFSPGIELRAVSFAAENCMCAFWGVKRQAQPEAK